MELGFYRSRPIRDELIAQNRLVLRDVPCFCVEGCLCEPTSSHRGQDRWTTNILDIEYTLGKLVDTIVKMPWMDDVDGASD